MSTCTHLNQICWNGTLVYWDSVDSTSWSTPTRMATSTNDSIISVLTVSIPGFAFLHFTYRILFYWRVGLHEPMMHRNLLACPDTYLTILHVFSTPSEDISTHNLPRSSKKKTFLFTSNQFLAPNLFYVFKSFDLVFITSKRFEDFTSLFGNLQGLLLNCQKL